MNFCAPIDVLSGDIPSGSCPSGVAAVCELPASTNERVGSKYLTKGSLLKYSLQMGLVMEYSMGEAPNNLLTVSGPPRGRSKAIVKFECSEALTEPVIKFVSEDGGNVKFVVESSVTCLSLPSTCQGPDGVVCDYHAEGPGFDSLRGQSWLKARLASRPLGFSAGKGTHLSYDLSALHKRTGNWEVSTPEGEYHFNLCGGLNPIEGLTCSGGATAACRVDKKTMRPLSLGTHFERPFITPGSKTYDERSIVLTYVDPAIPISITRAKFVNKSRRPTYHTYFEATRFKISKISPIPRFFTEALLDRRCEIRLIIKFLTLSREKLWGGSVCKSTTDGGKKNNSSLYADESKTERRHSLVLRLSCSMFNSKRPHFEGFRPEDCTHHVVWQTAEACPIEVALNPVGDGLDNVTLKRRLPHDSGSLQFARGKNCEVSLSHDADRHFNFNSLRNSTNDYIIPANNITFRMNLCGPLVHPCSKDKYASVCMIENETGREVVVGRGLLTEPVFSDGKLTFSSGQVGDSCSGGSHPSSVIFIVICDYKDLNSQPQFFTQDVCLFYFVWSTVVACWNRVQSSCSAVGQLGQQKLIYDLSPLTMTSDNYRVPVRPGVFIYLNVCHSVVPTYGMLCHPSAAACLVNMTTDPQNRAVSIGTIETEDSPEIVDGQLVLRYRSGDICYNGADGSITTLIQFKCDPNSHLTAPHLVSAHGCSYLLEWTTSTACPNISSNMPSVHADWQSPPKSTQNTVLPSSTSGPSVEQISSPCTVKSPLTDKLGFGWSARVVRKRAFTVVSSLALRRYRLIAVFSSAGGFIARIQGATDHGACLETELGSRDLGTANTDLLYSPETGVYLSYTGEGGCSTVIEFMCRPTDNHVVVADRIDRCQTRLIFETVLVCEDELAKYCCHGENGALCTGFQGDHEIKMVTHNGMPATVWLSVCRPLSESGLAHCGNGVSACLVENDSPTSGTHVLGYPFVRPSFLGGGLISLIYTGGDSCPNSAERYSTSVIFRCDKNAGEGSPKFLDMDGCRYRFEWRTSVICTDIGDGDGGGEIGGFDGEGALTDACPSAIDSSPLFKSLLVNLSKTQDIVVVSNTSRTEYKIRLCSTDARDRSLRTLDDDCRIDGVICTRKLDGTSMGNSWKLYAHFKTVDVTESMATLHHRVASAKGEEISDNVIPIAVPTSILSVIPVLFMGIQSSNRAGVALGESYRADISLICEEGSRDG
ncbi:hypothetical protein AAG570_002653 [Ranatra chinensis]|uniref:MRH domain-containing protein n=1 Tax=Ranatra chinensis TaxID=642074 RepID=A0ABD0YMC2_9HEMI